MSKGILDETHDFIDLFVYAAGEWTTPSHFHHWAAASLIAACVEDRVYAQVFSGEPLYPNIWVFLIGPSGTGKDHAIGNALRLIEPDDPLWILDGKTTMPALIDYLALQQRTTGRESAPVYLVTSDVTEHLPLGPEAKDFTSRSLNFYGGRKRDLVEITRTGGTRIVKKPLMNWVAGCTPDWFPMAIDPLLFTSGFAGRGFFIFGEPRYENLRLQRVMLHHDTAEVLDHLRRRVAMFQMLEGKAEWDDHAKLVFQGWLDDVAQAAMSGTLSDTEQHVVNRMRTSAQKLAIIYTVSGWEGGPLIVKEPAVTRAIAATQELLAGVKRINDFAFITSETKPMHAVLDAIRLAPDGEILHARLLKHALHRGVKSRDDFKRIVDSLIEAGYIEKDFRRKNNGAGRQPTIYRYKRRRVQLVVLEGGKNEEPETLVEETDDGIDTSESGGEE